MIDKNKKSVQETRRIFIGVPVKLDEDFNCDLQDLRYALAGNRITWVNQLNMHITIHFLGDLNTIELNQLLTDFNRFDFSGSISLQVSGLDIFGTLYQPKVLFARVKDEQEWQHLYDLVFEKFNLPNLNIEKKPYKPHLTLGRIRQVFDQNSFKNIADDFKNGFKLYQDKLWICVYESHLTPEGSRYTILAQKLLC